MKEIIAKFLAVLAVVFLMLVVAAIIAQFIKWQAPDYSGVMVALRVIFIAVICMIYPLIYFSRNR